MKPQILVLSLIACVITLLAACTKAEPYHDGVHTTKTNNSQEYVSTTYKTDEPQQNVFFQFTSF